MFMGEYNHSIDAKGRLIIPAKFREALGEEFIVTKGIDGCLYVYDQKTWESVEEGLQQLPPTRDSRRMIRFLCAGAASVDLDKQGRVLIPGNLREYAKLDKDVVLIGAAKRVEIWDKQLYEDMMDYDDVDDIAERMADLGLNV